MVAIILASVGLLLWLYLIFGRGRFWRCELEAPVYPSPDRWPEVTAVIPARDEGECVGKAVGSLLRQDYPGQLSLILIDDQSADNTAEAARDASIEAGATDRLTVVTGAPLATGWTGKLWAMHQGVARSAERPTRYLLFTDADIIFQKDAVARLVAEAEAESLVLNSLMVRLRCESMAERALIPAFVFFFQMLYPFSWVNRPASPTAAAAGGCMLVRSDALRRAGGIESIRTALIDDCALAARLKPLGPIRLSLTERVESIRAYPALDDIRRMVARSAYAQLRYSPLLLAGTVAGMFFTYVAPVLLALFARGLAQYMALLTWLLMAWSFQPTLRLYRLSPLWGPLLPFVALGYMAFTLDSAYQHARGRGGIWKGRAQAGLS